MSLVIKFYSTSSMLNMFRTLIHPSSGACDFFYCITTLVVCSCFDVCWSARSNTHKMIFLNLLNFTD